MIDDAHESEKGNAVRSATLEMKDKITGYRRSAKAIRLREGTVVTTRLTDFRGSGLAKEQKKGLKTQVDSMVQASAAALVRLSLYDDPVSELYTPMRISLLPTLVLSAIAIM